MTSGPRVTLCAFAITGALIATFALSQTSEPEGHVTAIFNEVQVLPEKADARPAVINDKVDDGTGLRTGDASRSELTFADLTITRLGANTIFSFNKAGRSVRLDSGAILLYARKNSGPAQVSTKAVTVGITGTTVIVEAKPDSYDELTVLEGDARFSLNNFPDQSTEIRGGQLLHVRAGSKKLPKPGRADLRRILNSHPLIRNFPPLPSLDLIRAIADGGNPNPPLQPQPPPQPASGGTGPVTGPVTGLQGGPSPVYLPTGPPSGGGGGSCWVCLDGRVVQLSEGDVRARRVQCYGSEEEARRYCSANSSKQTCWCCVNGQVVQTTEADCQEREGQCYGSRKEARKHCRGGEQTSTPTPTPHHRGGEQTSTPTPTPHHRGGEQSSTPTPTPHHRTSSTPHPTPKPTPHPTPQSTTGRTGYPNNQSEPNPILKNRYPSIRRGRPTPRPGQFIH